MKNYRTRALKELYWRFHGTGRFAITTRDAVQMLVIVICGRQKLRNCVKGTNRAKMRLAEWLFDSRKGMWKFLRLWEVLEDLRWRQRKGRFYEDWLQISWADLFKELDCSRPQLRRFLRLMEKAGIIERKSWKLTGKKVKVLRIHLNVFRLDDLIKRAARVSRHISIKKGETQDAPKKIKTGKGGNTNDGGSDLKNQGGNPGKSAGDSEIAFSCIKVPVLPSSEKKEKDICTSSGDVANISSKDENSDLPVVPPAAPSAQEDPELTPETFRNVQRLKRIFPESQFTAKILLQLERAATKLVPAYRMSEERVKEYVRAATCDDAIRKEDSWLFRCKDVSKFVQRWSRILPVLKRMKYVDTAMDAADTLRNMTEECYMDDLHLEALDVVRSIPSVLAQGVSVSEVFTAKISKCHGVRHTSESVRWRAASYIADPMEFMTARAPLLKRALMARPGLYRVLKNTLPLSQWAGLTSQDRWTLDRLGDQFIFNLERKASLLDLYEIDI